MSGARRVAIPVAFAGWIYSWVFFREVRSEYESSAAAAPLTILLVMGAVTTILIATAITAAMRSPLWPPLAVAGAVAFAALVIGGQLSTMQAALDFAARGGNARSVTIGEAFDAALRSRSPAGVGLVTAMPTVLALSGITGLVLRRPS